jgi:ApaG protein
MYSATTNGVRVTVRPDYDYERSDPAEHRYFWTYSIEILNVGDRTVKLTHRQWRITDANGKREDIRGPGVVGETPTLRPGQSYRYTSGCPLTTPSGIMAGAYLMVDEDGSAFDVTVPTFSLDSPSGRGRAN